MNLEWTRVFVELVKSGAPLKAYQKKLGLNKEGLQLHLGKLAEYEAALEPKKTEVEKAKPVEKKASKVLGLIKKVKERLDSEVVEHEQDEKDNDNAS